MQGVTQQNVEKLKGFECFLRHCTTEHSDFEGMVDVFDVDLYLQSFSKRLLVPDCTMLYALSPVEGTLRPFSQ